MMMIRMRRTSSMMKTRGMTNRRRIAALDFDSFFVNRNSRYRGGIILIKLD